MYALNSATTGVSSYGVYGEADSIDAGAAGVFGFVPFGSFGSGVDGASASPYGQGVLGVNSNLFRSEKSCT